MAEEWHYSKGNERLGPVSTEELRAMATDGRLSPEDLIWREGQADWVPARNTRGLFPQTSGPPPIVIQPASPPVHMRPQHQAFASPPAVPEFDEDNFDELPERVGFGPRFGAILIDGVAEIVAAIVLGVVVAGVAASEAGNPIEAEAFAIGGFMIGAGLVGILYGLWEGLTGAAAGKLATGLIIANEDGTPAPTGVLLKRYWAKSGVASVFPVIAGLTNNESMSVIGGLWGLAIVIGCFVALGEKRQALHDMIAHTAVFRKADIEERPSRQSAPERRTSASRRASTRDRRRAGPARGSGARRRR